MTAIEPNELGKQPAKEFQLIDTRQPEIFADGFIEGALSIPYNSHFKQTLQEVISEEQKTVIIADANELPTVMKELKAAGIVNLHGYLHGGFEAWKQAGGKTDMLILIEADEFAMDYQFDEFFLIDTRPADEYKQDHVEDSENIELSEIERLLPELDLEGRYYVYGNTAQDAVTAASIFKRDGFQQIRPVVSDYETIKQSGVALYAPKKKSDADKKISQ